MFIGLPACTPLLPMTGTALGSRRKISWTRGSSLPSSRSELGQLAGMGWGVGALGRACSGWVGGSPFHGEGTPVGSWVFLDHRERERELYGPKKRGPKPKTFLLKVTWPSPRETPSPGTPSRAPSALRALSKEREGQRCSHCRRPSGRAFLQSGPQLGRGVV